MGEHGASSRTRRALRLTGIDPATGRILRRQPLPCAPGSPASGAGGLWGTPDGRRLVAIRPRGRMRAVPGLRLPGRSADLAVGAGRLWVSGVRDIVTTRGERRGDGLLTAGDARTGVAGPARRLGQALPGHAQVAVGAGAVWVANTPPGTLARADPRTGRVVARIRFRAGR